MTIINQQADMMLYTEEQQGNLKDCICGRYPLVISIIVEAAVVSSQL